MGNIKIRGNRVKKTAKQVEYVVYVHPRRQEHYVNGKQIRITDPSEIGRLG